MTFLALGHTPDPDPGTVLCRTCGSSCVPYGNDQWRHAKPVCGIWMPRAHERCARRAGHAANDHRTRYALECQKLARRAA